MTGHNVVVRPVRFTDGMPKMRGFLETLALRARVESERGGWVDMVAGAGMVALHSAAGSDPEARNVYGGHTGLVALHSGRPKTRIIAGPGAVQLGFETRQPLADVAIRLTKAGHRDAMVRRLELGEVLCVTDPDGQPVVVLPAPSPDSP
jgi:hypothetical protein